MKASSNSPTMKDVAQAAGVSLGTVSKVMNGIPVGDSYRRRVTEAAERLGYQVNNYARGLKTNKTYSVALILPSIRHPYFAALADEVTAVLMHKGYRTMLMITNYDREAEQKCITMVKQNKADGIIALTYNPDLEVDPAIPFVSIDRHCNASVPCVSSDNFGGGRIAAEKLMALGCKKLLFLRIGSSVSSEVDKRAAGFENACRMKGADFESVILDDKDTEEPFYTFIEQHVHDGKFDFDGIFCNTDKLACLIRMKLDELGISVPGDVQLIGFDGLIDVITGKPLCSSIVQPIDLIAETAVSILLNRDSAAMPALMSLPVHFIEGGTTKEDLYGE